MTRRSPQVPRLDDLVALMAQLRDDETVDAHTLRRRDREIGRALPAGSTRAERVLGWLAACRREARRPAERARRIASIALFAAGAIVGLAAAKVVLSYDGRYPVNVFEVLAVFVGLQLALLAATGIVALPPASRRRVPGLGALADALSVLSPGRWHGAARRLLPPAGREALDLAIGRGRAHRRLLAHVQRWVVLSWSQIFAVAFNLGAIATCLFLVAFTDLAFGWSTTLDVDDQGFYRLVSALAAPWASWLPEARPSLELVEASRIFRLGEAGPAEALRDAVGPEVLTQWWGFIIASLACYGLAPRAGLWLLARQRLQAAVSHAFEHVPGVADLCDRLDQPLVETTALEPEVEAPPLGPAPAAGSDGADGRSALVVDWAGTTPEALDAAALATQATGAGTIAVHSAGGAASVAEDRAVIERIRAAAPGDDFSIVVLVRAWEPPVLEFVDFADDLRDALGDGVPVVVVAATFDGDRPAETPADDLARWQRRLAAAGDPWLSVRGLQP